ncbi:hypothetical protein B296_00056443 [Ensete ventricosum]|uniref:Uncharacterized protein n=1 Tax=Ensete ventricosum TaxID=4639 RepID=A0A426XI45_ENSVE|nr:hypothetical protein B296_00056443 [Ensete ventricosum]
MVLLIYTWVLDNFLLTLERCASFSGRRLVGREPKRSTRAGVDFWSLVELQSFEVCYDIPEGVTYPRSRDIIWLASVTELPSFASVSFYSSVGSPLWGGVILTRRCKEGYLMVEADDAAWA